MSVNSPSMKRDTDSPKATEAEPTDKRKSTPTAASSQPERDPVRWKRVAATLITVTLALVLSWQLWWHYMRSPWTRDGRVRAETVDVAADVSGRVTDLRVIDNQVVHKGDVLFIVDPDTYRFALAQAEAAVQTAKVDLQNRQELAERRRPLGSRADV